MDEDLDLERLKDVARRLDDLFELSLPDAPGCAFVGGRFVAPDGASLSFGAADFERPRAFRRCIGEAAETLSQYLALRGGDPVVLTDAPSGLDANEETRLRRRAGPAVAAGWTAARRLSNDTPAGLPGALCFRDAAPEPPGGLSLGAAAGRSAAEATLSALMELVERDAVARWWRAGTPANRIAASVAADGLRRLRGGATGRRTWLLDIAGDIGVPVVAALSCNDDGRGMAAGFAARATLASACQAALLELAQMELGNRHVAMKSERLGVEALPEAERRHLDRMRRLSSDDRRFRPAESLAPGSPASLPREPGACVDEIVSRLGRAGIEVFGVDLTVPAFGIPVVKLVAPLLAAEPVWLDTPGLPEALSRQEEGISGIAII